jgi:hypothetical protein
MGLHAVYALLQEASVVQDHGAIRAAGSQQILLAGIKLDTIHLCCVRHSLPNGLLIAKVPEHEVLVIANRGEKVWVQVVPRNVLHNAEMRIVPLQCLHHLQHACSPSYTTSHHLSFLAAPYVGAIFPLVACHIVALPPRITGLLNFLKKNSNMTY